MTPKRTVVVAVAVAVGVVASLLSYFFLNNAQQRAFHNAKMVSAYVITKPVPTALSGSSAVSGGYVEKKSVPAEFVPAAAVTKLSAIEDEQAVAPFSVGQVLTSTMFATPTAVAGTFAASIPKGDVAVSVSVDQVHGVASLPVPGDKVDIMITVGSAENYMLQNVPVLAIGQSTAQASTAPSTGTQSATTTSATTNTSGLFTFAVRPSDAARIALAEQQSMGIYLALVPPGNPVTSVPAVDPTSILNGPQASG